MLPISLVTCTRNRAEHLARFFSHVERLGLEEVGAEFILVDNGSSDATMERFHAWAGGRKCAQAIREDAPGLSNARNAGWRASSGNLVAMIDDDCYAQPGFLEAWLAVFRENPRIGWASGKVVLHDPMDDPVAVDECEHVRHHPAREHLPCGEVQGANLAFRREVLERIGGFDPRMGVGTPFGCEDIDSAARAVYAGWPGLYHPAPVVRHNHGRRGGEGFRRLRTVYADGEGAYYAKCILDPAMRKDYLRPFLARLYRRPWKIRGRLLRAAWLWWWSAARRSGAPPSR